MSEIKKKIDSRQVEHRTPLKRFNKNAVVAGVKPILKDLVDSLDQELDYPLRPHASFPAQDARLNFSASITEAADGASKVHSPVRKQIFDLNESWINFGDQSLSDVALFEIQWPTPNTVGYFRHACFTLIGSGQINVLFTPEAVDLVSLQNPGGYFVNGGLPLGYVTLECTDILGYFKTPGALTSIITEDSIFRFGSGSGGGSGSGDANSFTENLKHRLTASYYQFVTPVVFSIDEQNLTESATATYDLVDGVYRFDAAGEEFVSVDMFDTDFKDAANDAGYEDSRQVELHAEWFNQDSIDFNATYEMALDGVNYQTVSMQRQLTTTKYTGSLQFDIPANTVISEQPADNTNTELSNVLVTEIDKIITLEDKFAARQLSFELNKIGSPLGSVIVKICKDQLGNAGDVLYQTSILASTLSAGLNVITLNNFRIVLPIQDYHIVIETDDAYKASFSAGVNSVRVRTLAGDLKFSLLGHIYDLRVRVTSSAGDKRLAAFGAFYAETISPIVQGIQQLQKFTFSGDDDVTSLEVTNFLPNPAFLKIYDVRTGQVYRYPAFGISGHEITFDSGTFLVPGATIELILDQSEGTGFDYSDENANLLASNHLGSTDATIDKSAPGRGIFLRRPDGTLRELVINDNDEIEIYSV